MLYQSKTYASGGPGADDTEVGDPCLTTHLMFDVKGTEQALPTIIPFPGLASLGTVRTHARVQLKKVVVFKGSLPLAVPEVSPKNVTATFMNDAGSVVSSFELTGPTASGSLNAWTGSGSVAVPAGANARRPNRSRAGRGCLQCGEQDPVASATSATTIRSSRRASFRSRATTRPARRLRR